MGPDATDYDLLETGGPFGDMKLGDGGQAKIKRETVVIDPADLIDFDEGEESEEDEDFDEFELKNMESKRKAATAIMELAKNNAIRAYVVRDGGIKAITSLVGYEDEHLRSICATTLFVLSQQEETHEKMIEDDDEAAALLLAEAVMGCKEVEIDELELITPIREARKKLLLGSAFRPLGDDPEDEKINPTESSAISKLFPPYGYPYGGSSSPGVSEAARFLEEGPQRMLHATLLGVDGYDVKDAPAAVPAPSVQQFGGGGGGAVRSERRAPASAVGDVRSRRGRLPGYAAVPAERAERGELRLGFGLRHHLG